MEFNSFNFHPDLQEGLDAMGFKQATPIQQQAIPHILAGRDIIACAQTGTGKTAAFVLPVLNKLSHEHTDFVNTLIIAPTRELAIQIDQQIEGFSYFTNVGCIAIFGGGDGASWDQQKKALEQGAEIVVATPGRLIALLNSDKIRFDKIQHLILDEADRMLDMGFMDDINRIISYLPKERQTLLFSATMPPKIRQLANKILKDPAEISISISKPAEGISQKAFLTFEEQKLPLLKFLLQSGRFTSTIVFASTKEKVKKLGRELSKVVPNLEAFHSELEQSEREKIMSAFKAKKLQVLIGTDILSRGIDVEGISLVVNYDVPPDPEDYVHRVGRTARAATTGEAITFVNEQDMHKFGRIEQMIEKDIMKTGSLPAGIGEGPEYNPNKKFPKQGFGNRNGSGGKGRSGGGAGKRKFHSKPKPKS